MGRPLARPASSLNHRSRSRHGTAAFAGEVEGSTNSFVSPSVRCCTPSSGRSPKAPRYASLPTKPIQPGFSSSAIRASRSPSKSSLRRSPEPGVVLYAAFVIPMPSARTSNCSLGSYSLDVKRAACRSRQKSFRGFAKWACAAAETRPGLIPQKSTRSPGARTSGTELGGFSCVGGQALVQPCLEAPAQVLARDGRVVARPARLDLDRLDGRVVVAVTTGVALCFRQRPEPPHGPKRRTRLGRHNPTRGRESEGIPVRDRPRRELQDRGGGAARRRRRVDAGAPAAGSARPLLDQEPRLSRAPRRQPRRELERIRARALHPARERRSLRRDRDRRRARGPPAGTAGRGRAEGSAREGRARLLHRRVADREAAVPLVSPLGAPSSGRSP